jgi:hypothetical protein
MLYTFAVLRNPLKAIETSEADYSHFFGGELGEACGLDPARYARVMSLDLSDPLLSFLRFQNLIELPLLMDFAAGSIAYTVLQGGVVRVHEPPEGSGESLLDEPLPRSPFRLEPIPYEQYRAAAFVSAVIDDSFLTSADRHALGQLGESYTQVGGHHPRALDYQPYCGNPACDGHGTQVTQLLATVSQEPSTLVSLDFLPDDPAIQFGFCMHCHSIVGSIAVD